MAIYSFHVLLHVIHTWQTHLTMQRGRTHKMTEPTTEGGCLCGAIRYKAFGEPQGSGYCHCKSCRHHTGAPITAYVVFSAKQVQWTSADPARYESSPGKFRAFCRDCGTSLTWEGTYKGEKIIDLHVGTLDKPEQFPPNEHTHYSERIHWLELTDDLPKFQASFE